MTFSTFDQPTGHPLVAAGAAVWILFQTIEDVSNVIKPKNEASLISPEIWKSVAALYRYCKVLGFLHWSVVNEQISTGV